MLPKYLAMGLSYKEFIHCTPKLLRAYDKSYDLKKRMQDESMWTMGQYVLSAVSVAVDHCLNGRKANSKYVEKPFLFNKQKEESELTEEELQKQREMFVAMLNIKKTNFELNNKKR